MEENEDILQQPLRVETVKYTVHEIFEPTDKDMKIEYPELSGMTEFDNMPNNDIKFCWYFGCKSSPFFGLPDETEKVNSVREAYGADYLEIKQAVDIIKDIYSSEIIAGINRMKIFSPALRSRANAMLTKILDNMDKAINIQEEQLMAMDSSGKKAFISLSVDVANNLPNIVNQLEGGFSLSKAIKKNNKLQGNNTTGNPLNVESKNLMDKIVSVGNNDDEEIF